MYYAGFSECDITPPLGSIIPGGFAARFNRSIGDRIYTRAAVIGDGDKRCAVVTIDACGIYRDVTERVRERVAEHCPKLPRESVMVMADHIHAGGPTLNWGEEVVADPVYIDRIVYAAADAVITADAQADKNDVRLVEASSDLPGLSFVRDWRMKDGSIRTNPGMNNPDLDEPYTKPDTELKVVAAMNGDRPIGAVVNFALHPAIVAGSYTSGDFIGVMARELKRTYGPEFVTVFVNGACGNINHLNFRDPETGAKGRHVYVGERIAQRVAEMLSGSPHELKGKAAFGEAPVRLGVRRPTKESLADAWETLTALGPRYAGIRPSDRGYQTVFYAMQALERMLDKRDHIDTSVQIVNLCGTPLVGYPAQLFTEFGFATKAALPGAMVAIFAGDYLGYAPHPDAFVPGVYEARLCGTSMLATDAGDALVAAAADLAANMKL